MVAHMVADMEVDMVADMVADQVANIDSVTVSLFSFQLLISQTRTKELKCSETLFDGKCVQPTFVSSKALQVYSSSTWTIINAMIAAFLCPCQNIISSYLIFSVMIFSVFEIVNSFNKYGGGH